MTKNMSESESLTETASNAESAVGNIQNSKAKLYKVTADYRKNNPNKPCYYVRAKTKKEAKERFNNIISWLDIYDVEVCEDSIVEKIMEEPMKHIII